MAAPMNYAQSASPELWMKWALGPLIAVTTMWGQAPRQVAHAPLPTFDVASVKPSVTNPGQPGAERERGWGDVTGRVNLLHIGLSNVLLRAYGIEPYQFQRPQLARQRLYRHPGAHAGRRAKAADPVDVPGPDRGQVQN
jgi:hypothetical protein